MKEKLSKIPSVFKLIGVGFLVSATIAGAMDWVVPISLLLLFVGIIKLILDGKPLFIIMIVIVLAIIMFLNRDSLTDVKSLLQYSLTALMVHYMIMHNAIKF